MKKYIPKVQVKAGHKSLLPIAILGATLTLSIVSCNKQGSATTTDTESNADNSYYQFDTAGDLVRPTGYRSWIYVGTPVTPNDMNGGKAPFPEMHNVYIDPVSYDYWKENGKWRDGTILVKELVSIGSKAAVSGRGYFAGEFIGLEATIKSSDQFPKEPGNWAYFSFTNPTEGTLKNTATAFKTASCNSCHDASASDDFVFTQYYPVLSAAKGAGKDVEPEDKAARKAGTKKSEAKKTGKWDPTAPTPSNANLGIPVDKEALFKWLKSEKYKAFPSKETSMHESDGPHQALGLPVRVFMNDTITASLTAGNEEHPQGSIVVKEMFNEDKSPYGWAVMAKTHDASDNGKGWFWYEVTDSNDSTKIAAHGNGVMGCVKCHSSGDDLVRSAFPLK